MGWHKPLMIKYDGYMFSLAELAYAFNVPYAPAWRRYKRGERDALRVLFGDEEPQKLAPISDADLAYLRETKPARAGQDDEWEIACDLIGQPRCRKGELRRLLS